MVGFQGSGVMWDSVEVLQPKALTEEFKTIAKRMVKNYPMKKIQPNSFEAVALFKLSAIKMGKSQMLKLRNFKMIFHT